MERKFAALRIIAVVLKVLAWVDAALTVIGFLVLLVAGAAMPKLGGPYGGYGMYGAMGGIAMAFMVLVVGALYFIGLLAWADMIYVFLAIEENTRGLKPPAQTSAV